jgi:hypothetical protein
MANQMPLRSESTALTFDPTKPRELYRFFEDLEQLFSRASVDDKIKKSFVVRYVDFNTEEMWSSLKEFKDPTSEYPDFKKAILAHYPDATGDFTYSLRDVDILVGERQRLGIVSNADLTHFHLRFNTITNWLIDKKYLSQMEQQRAYIRAFTQPLLPGIMNRLQLKFPDRHPSLPYEIEDVHKAAQFVLQSAAAIGYQAPNTMNTAPAEDIKDIGIKKEDFSALLSEFGKTIIEALNINSRPRPGPSTGPRNSMECAMCGGPHFIRDCMTVDDFIKAGKCKRNYENKVVLPSGAFVSRDTPGRWLMDRLDEWHRRHPNQLAAAAMIHTISRNIVDPWTTPN